jgi:hypothetical protein
MAVTDRAVTGRSRVATNRVVRHARGAKAKLLIQQQFHVWIRGAMRVIVRMQSGKRLAALRGAGRHLVEVGSLHFGRARARHGPAIELTSPSRPQDPPPPLLLLAQLQ